jgi:hypothetical protein
MTRITCECGESFSETLINGAARAHCPFCRRTIVPTGSGVGPEDNHRPLHPDVVGASNNEQPLVARWGSQQLTSRSLEQLFAILENQPTVELSCPRGGGCTVSRCRHAFRCGALPERLSGWSFVGRWTAVTFAVAFVLAAILLISAFLLGRQFRDPIDFWATVATIGGFVSAPALVALGVTSLLSRWQRKHVRALCQAAEATGLRLVNFVKVPDNLRSAVPALYPGGSLRRDEPVSGKVMSEVVLHGSYQEQRMIVARFEYDIDAMDFAPFGALAKVGAGFIWTRLWFNRKSQRQWLGHVLAVCGEPLDQTPDFFLSPSHGPMPGG